MNIELATIVDWMTQLDPSAEMFNPQDTDPAAMQARQLCDALSASMSKFLEDNGYTSTAVGWVK